MRTLFSASRYSGTSFSLTKQSGCPADNHRSKPKVTVLVLSFRPYSFYTRSLISQLPLYIEELYSVKLRSQAIRQFNLTGTVWYVSGKRTVSAVCNFDACPCIHRLMHQHLISVHALLYNNSIQFCFILQYYFTTLL